MGGHSGGFPVRRSDDTRLHARYTSHHTVSGFGVGEHFNSHPNTILRGRLSVNQPTCLRVRRSYCGLVHHLFFYFFAGHVGGSGFLFRLEQKIGAMTEVAFIGR
jgi:hypothetical protein